MARFLVNADYQMTAEVEAESLEAAEKYVNSTVYIQAGGGVTAEESWDEFNEFLDVEVKAAE